MNLSEQQIRKIVEETVRSVAGNRPSALVGVSVQTGTSGQKGWMCDDINDAIANAKTAQYELMQLTLEHRGRIVESMRAAAVDNAEYLAKLAHEDTGYGRIEDKIQKNILSAQRTPGIEDLETQAFTGDDGLTLVESAPFGVIGAITPCTNPTSTIVNNTMSMVAAGNTVVFNPHPAAIHSSQEAMRIMNEACIKAGGPANVACCATQPNIETSTIICSHPDIKMLAITGGEAIVKIAMKSGKKAVCAGPGNPPVIVDETADIPKAAADIVKGSSFDNNVMCFEEKECFAVSSIMDELMRYMEQNGAYKITGSDIDKVVNTTLQQKDGKWVINRKWVGRNANAIMDAAGVSYTGAPRLIIAEVDKDHPFIHTEMMMPVLGIVRCADFDEALREAFRAERGCWHSSMIHSTNVKRLSLAAKTMNTTIFVKNGPSLAGVGLGGEGFCTLTIATPTGEGLTSARTFTRKRRCVLRGDMRII